MFGTATCLGPLLTVSVTVEPTSTSRASGRLGLDRVAGRDRCVAALLALDHEAKPFERSLCLGSRGVLDGRDLHLRRPGADGQVHRVTLGYLDARGRVLTQDRARRRIAVDDLDGADRELGIGDGRFGCTLGVP